MTHRGFFTDLLLMPDINVESWCLSRFVTVKPLRSRDSACPRRQELNKDKMRQFKLISIYCHLNCFAFVFPSRFSIGLISVINVSIEMYWKFPLSKTSLLWPNNLFHSQHTHTYTDDRVRLSLHTSPQTDQESLLYHQTWIQTSFFFFLTCLRTCLSSNIQHHEVTSQTSQSIQWYSLIGPPNTIHPTSSSIH